MLEDKIIIKNLQVRNIIGVDSWERSKRQPLVISITVFTDISKSGFGDLLSESINYGTVCKVVQEFSETTEYRSTEALAVGIAKLCINRCGAKKVYVEVEKPRALLHASAAGVSITRTAEEIQTQIDEAVATTVPAQQAVGSVDVLGDDTIFVKNLTASTIIGVNTWERVERQRVLVDFTVFLKFDPAVIAGDIVPKMHNYRRMTRIVTDLVASSDFKTVEALATHIADTLLTSCYAPKVLVRVRKPSALVFAESAGIEIVRERTILPGTTPAVPRLSGDAVSGNIQHVVYLAFGSNLGDRVGNIERGLRRLKEHTTLLDCSFLYETSPMYVTDQPLFLNAVCKFTTALSPSELLKFLKLIEEESGRDFSTIRNGPRTLDIDIIFYDNLQIKTDYLVIPHPRIAEREFVLRPLCDIAADFEHPKLFRNCKQLLSLLLHTENKSPESVNRVTVLRGKTINWSARTYSMGILNVTPDSFSDGGQFSSTTAAVECAKKMQESGVDIIDIGGQSTRPDAELVTEDEEAARVIPVIKALREAGVQVPISVDTFRASVARKAVDAGADFVNDVSGGSWDGKMFEVMGETATPVCLMHMRGTPKTMTQLTEYKDDDVMKEIQTVLSEQVKKAIAKGVRRWNIIIDPGIGFAKTAEQSYDLIRNLARLTSNRSGLDGFPVLVGPSRKRFLGTVTNKVEPKDRVFATAAACTAAVAGGAAILRVHDVAEMIDVLKVADTLYKKN